MWEIDLASARSRELEAFSRTIDQRVAWEGIATVEKLERALKRARHQLPAGFAEPVHA